MEEKKIEGEEENLNSDKKTTYTLEEVEEIKRKMQSDSEKGVQKVIMENKIYNKTLDEVGKVAEDPAYLVSLFETDEQVAKVILGKYYDGQSIEEYKETINYQEDMTNPEVIKRKIEKEAEKRLQQKELQTKVDEFITKYKISDEKKAEFLGAFEERKQLKSFKFDEIEKNLIKAYRDVSDEDIKHIQNQTVIANTLGTGEGKGGGQQKQTKMEIAQQEAGEFLKKFKI